MIRPCIRLSQEAWEYKKKTCGRRPKRDADSAEKEPTGTFEGYLSSKAAGLQGDDLVAFLLDAVPYIHEYESQRLAAPNEVAAGGTGVAKLVSKEIERSPRTILARLKSSCGDATADDLAEIGRMDRVTPDELNTCTMCGGRFLIDSASFETCADCGIVRSGEVFYGNGVGYNISPCEREHMEIQTRFCYKRINHFNEWLASLQGCENTDVPDEIVEQVRAEFVKARLTAPEDVTQIRTRQFLKKLGHVKMYEHSYHICKVLGGQSPELIPRDLEQKLKSMFLQVQHPFECVKPPDRKNFLSYGYTLYKFMQLLGHDEYLQYLPLLKCPNKLFKHDKVWAGICEILQWQFLPTV